MASTYPAPELTRHVSPTQTRQSVAIPQRVARPAARAGHLGNLSQAQEAKLRALWAVGFKFIEFCEADKSLNAAATLEEKYVPPAQKTGSTSRRRGGGVVMQQHPMLVNEILSLLPPDERNATKLAEAVVESLDHWTPHMYRLIVLRVVKHEHPDELALRFLRASDWDLIRATRMMGKTIYWRTMEAAIDDQILLHGEGGAAEDEKNGQGHARTLGADFMTQIRTGKSFLHGNDKEGRPIIYIRVRLHMPGEQSTESLQRFTIYMIELARLSLRYPVEEGTIVLDMSKFRFANFDLAPLRFLLTCVEQYYPECIGLIIIHNAPTGTKALWRLIRLWVDKCVSSKVKFTRGRKALAKYIDASQILKDHGGDDDWQYEYEEPQPDENFKMHNTITCKYLLEERRALARDFEETTKEWVMNAQGTDKAAEVCARRDAVVHKLAANYWEMDPYVRARSLYDRQGCFRGVANVNWRPSKAGFRRTVSVARRSSVSGSAASGTLVPGSLVGSPIKEDSFEEEAEAQEYEIASIADDDSCYSE